MSVKYDGCSRWSSRHRARFGEPGPLGSKTGEGVELNLTNLVAAVARSDGGMIFLETGSPSSRLCHIIEIHDDEFSKIGVAENQITDVGVCCFRGANRWAPKISRPPVYEVIVNGQPQRIAVTTGDGGGIVGANPAGVSR